MALQHDFSDALKVKLKKLFRQDRRRYEILMKKIESIADSDEFTIEHYKNLRHELKEFKRVHVGGSFVLFFRVFRKEKFILFQKLEHHDDAYRR